MIMSIKSQVSSKKSATILEFSFPKEILNLIPHVIEDFCRLRRRLKRNLTGSDRLWSSTKKLKRKGNKFQKDIYKRKIEIEIGVESFKKPTSRSVKIAIPHKRILSGLKEHSVYTNFSKERKLQVNKLLGMRNEILNEKKSSRLTSIDRLDLSLKEQQILNKFKEAPSPARHLAIMKSIQRLNNAKRDYEAHALATAKSKFFADNAKFATSNIRRDSANANANAKANAKKNAYKNQILQAKEQREKENAIQEFYNRLSSPKSVNKSASSSPSWRLTKSMQNFKPSDRLLAMALPKKVHSNSSLNDILKVKKAALHYKASNRILKLALPTSLPERNPIDPYHVPESALHAKLTERINQLAYPKNRSERMIRKHPFKVSRRALNARPSKHIKELALPKKPPST